jgi:hypothetical protein
MRRGFVASAVVLILALVGFSLLLSAPHFQTVEAQSLSPPTVPNDICEEHETDAKVQTFFNAIIKENSSSAYDELVRQSAFLPTEKEQIAMQMRNRLAEVSVRYGEMLDYKKYGTRRIDEDIVLSQYILKCENAPILWTFGFYRKQTTSDITNDAPWLLFQLNLDTDVRVLMRP